MSLTNIKNCDMAHLKLSFASLKKDSYCPNWSYFAPSVYSLESLLYNISRCRNTEPCCLILSERILGCSPKQEQSSPKRNWAVPSSINDFVVQNQIMIYHISLANTVSLRQALAPHLILIFYNSRATLIILQKTGVSMQILVLASIATEKNFFLVSPLSFLCPCSRWPNLVTWDFLGPRTLATTFH